MVVPALHLADRLDRAHVQAASAEHVQVQIFVINRVARTVVFQHPRSRIEWPEMVLGETGRLETSLAVKPFVWERIGTPVSFRVGVLDASGVETTVLEYTLDARHTPEDRQWRPVVAGLESWRGQKVRLVFETRGHPDPVSYGWVGWGNPMVFDASFIKAPAQPASPVATTPRRASADIILVTCDALRADHVGCYGAPAGSTPHLDAFAEEAVCVRHARTVCDATLGSLVSLLTGRMPHETGVTAEWGEFPAHLPSLPVVLAGAGYHTVLASSEREVAAPGAGLARLFKESIPCIGNPCQHSSLTVRRLAARLRELDPAQPVFVWMQLFEPHPPDVPEAPFAAEFTGDPSVPHQPEVVRGIHAIESALHLDSWRTPLAAGQVPPALVHRLEETVRALRGDLDHGPDLATHLEALGPEARGGRDWPDFLQWLAGELSNVRASGGRGSSSLLQWLAQINSLLTEAESDLLGWLDGVQDIRYPMAHYAASVKSADHAFGQLLSTLRELGRHENAVIVFTSPHGELFHAPPVAFEHHELHEDVLRVPLLIKPPGTADWRVGAVDGPMPLDKLAATLLDYSGASAPGALGREHSCRNLLAGREHTAPDGMGVAVTMQGVAACLHRPPFKLVRFHADGIAWPWLPDHPMLRSGETLLFHGEPVVDDTRDVSAAHPDIVAGMAAELERLAPIAAFIHKPLEAARFEPAPAEEAAPAPAGSPAPGPEPAQGLSPLCENDIPDNLKPSEVKRLVNLEVHQVNLERELRESEERSSFAERRHRLDAMRMREMRRETHRLRKDLKQLARWLSQIGAGVAKLYGTRRWRFGNWFRTLRKGRDAGAGFPAVDVILKRFSDWHRGASFEPRSFDDEELSYLQWLRGQQPDGNRRRAMVADLDWLQARPRFGLVMAVPRDAGPQRVAEAVASVLSQSYGGWQLWLLDADAALRSVLPQDDRIRTPDSAALPGDVTHLAAMGAEDLLEPHALMELVHHLGAQLTSPPLVYTDEDEIGPSGAIGNPFLKPAWSPDTLESCNYVGALAVYERAFLQTLGADLAWLTPARAYDTVLRAAEQPGFRAERLPRLHYHRRRALEPARAALQEMDRQALTDAIQRRRDVASVRPMPAERIFRVLRPVWKQEKVVILIPTRDRLALLRRAVETLVEHTAYPHFEIVIINNDSRDPEAVDWLERCGHRVFHFPGPFNYAAMHNAAVRATDAPWLLFLNNDTEVFEPGWLTAMAEHVQRPEIGAVGAKLLFPDGSVQHAGVVLGIQGRAAHAFANRRPDDLAARGQLQMVRNYSAVTAACMMMRREVYDRIGGMDEERFAVAYNDVELCVRATRFGYRNLVTPYAVLKHHECASRPRRDHPHEVEHLQHTCFGPDGWTDPFYHPALNQREADFTLDGRV